MVDKSGIVGADFSGGPGWWLFGLTQGSGGWVEFASCLQREHPDDVPAMLTVTDDPFYWPVWTGE